MLENFLFHILIFLSKNTLLFLLILWLLGLTCMFVIQRVLTRYSGEYRKQPPIVKLAQVSSRDFYLELSAAHAAKPKKYHEDVAVRPNKAVSPNNLSDNFLLDELLEAGRPSNKKTRRGTRAGKNRRRFRNDPTVSHQGPFRTIRNSPISSESEE
jgi:hypothetical protein